LIRMSSRSTVAWAASARRRTSASAERSAARKSAAPLLRGRGGVLRTGCCQRQAAFQRGHEIDDGWPCHDLSGFVRPNQRQLSLPRGSASSSLFVFYYAWLEEDQLPQQPGLPRLRDLPAMHGQSIPLRVPSRERGCIGLPGCATIGNRGLDHHYLSSETFLVEGSSERIPNQISKIIVQENG